MIPKEQQRKRVKQAKGGRLADEAHLQRAVPGPAFEQGQRDADRELAHREDGHQPPGDDLPDGERDDGRHDVEPVRGWVEQLAQPAGLVERAGDLAVQPVGQACRDEQADGPVIRGGGPRAEHQPQEDRHPGQPGGADRVRDSEDAVHGASILT